MIVLGIESTAHTFGVGIVEDGRILANSKAIYIPRKGSGIIPKEASEFHALHAVETIRNALREANVEKKELDLIAFSQGPGLPPCLRIGATVARALALSLKRPVIGVNHCVAHIEIGKFSTGLKEPVTLYVSGGNTQILALEAFRYRIFGETLDIAIGNCLDTFARKAGLQGGPSIEEMAKKSKNLIELPYIVKGMDFSFSGILTNCIEKLKKNKIEDLCFSLQEYSFSMLTEATERALAHTEKEECLLTGGVAANGRLGEMLRIMCEERKCKFEVVQKEYAGDNGAQIAWLGFLEYNSGVRQNIKNTEIKPKWRADEVEVEW